MRRVAYGGAGILGLGRGSLTRDGGKGLLLRLVWSLCFVLLHAVIEGSLDDVM